MGGSILYVVYDVFAWTDQKNMFNMLNSRCARFHFIYLIFRCFAVDASHTIKPPSAHYKCRLFNFWPDLMLRTNDQMMQCAFACFCFLCIWFVDVVKAKRFVIARWIVLGIDGVGRWAAVRYSTECTRSDRSAERFRHFLRLRTNYAQVGKNKSFDWLIFVDPFLPCRICCSNQLEQIHKFFSFFYILTQTGYKFRLADCFLANARIFRHINPHLMCKNEIIYETKQVLCHSGVWNQFFWQWT